MKNKFGLLKTDIESINAILKSHLNVESAYIFGSRAKGTYENGSDVDIALKGVGLDFRTVSDISFSLNEKTNMPYKFDVLDYRTIEEPGLIEHINRVGIAFYKKSRQAHLQK